MAEGPYRPTYLGEMMQSGDFAGRREVLALGQALNRPLTPHQAMSTPAQGAYYRMGIGVNEADSAGGLHSGSGSTFTSFQPWFVERTIDIEKICAIVTTPGVASAIYSLYRNDDQLMRPDGDPWYQAPTVSLNGGGRREVDLKQVLEPGIWWVAYTAVGGGALVRGWVHAPIPYVMPLTAANLSAWNFGGYYSYQGTFPANITASTLLSPAPAGGWCPIMFAWCRQIDPPS